MTNPLDGNGVEALKPCPFCGAAFLIAQEPHDNHPVAGMFYIYHDYGPISSAARACIIDVRRHFASREEAITAWNTRTTSLAAQDGLVEALRAARRVIRELDQYQSDPRRGDYGVECACCMGELLDDHQDAIAQIDAALSAIKEQHHD